MLNANEGKKTPNPSQTIFSLIYLLVTLVPPSFHSCFDLGVFFALINCSSISCQWWEAMSGQMSPQQPCLLHPFCHHSFVCAWLRSTRSFELTQHCNWYSYSRTNLHTSAPLLILNPHEQNMSCRQLSVSLYLPKSNSILMSRKHTTGPR